MFFIKIGEFFYKNRIRLLVSFLIGLTIMALYNLSYSSSGVVTWAHLEYYRDGSFIAAMVIFFIGLLAVISFFGLFDIFSFYPKRKKKENGSKENFGDYVERKKKERGSFSLSFLSYILIALVYMTFSLVLFFLLQSQGFVSQFNDCHIVIKLFYPTSYIVYKTSFI